MLTPLSVSKVNATLQNQKRVIISIFPEHNRPKKIVDFYDHLCSMERHLRMSHKLGTDVVYLNQAEVETLTTDFSTLKY